MNIIHIIQQSLSIEYNSNLFNPLIDSSNGIKTFFRLLKVKTRLETRGTINAVAAPLGRDYIQ